MLRAGNGMPVMGNGGPIAVPPEQKIEAGWWNGLLVTRDYYIAAGADHCHYWIYRERIGDVDGDEPHWFLHGVFG